MIDNLEILHEKFCNESEYILNYSKKTISWYKNAFKLYTEKTGVSYLKDVTTDKYILGKNFLGQRKKFFFT